jgi:antitoxin ParD1/3/4
MLRLMNVSLTPELENLIHSKVNSGMYNTASEVVREGLRLIQERDEIREKKLAVLRSDIQLGIDDLEAGRTVDGEKFLLNWKKRLEKRIAKHA